MKFISRAIHDTFDGQMLRSIFIILGSALASYAGIYQFVGGKEAMLELPYIYAGLLGAFVPLTLLFMWNLACTPYRMMRDERDEMLVRLNDFGLPDYSAQRTAMKGKEKFTLPEAACLLAGETIRYSELTGNAGVILFEIKQRIISKEIVAHGINEQFLKIGLMSTGMFAQKDGKGPLINPEFTGAWIDRETLLTLANDYDVKIAGVTDGIPTV